MTQQLIITTPANSGRGDSPKSAFDKINANFSEVYPKLQGLAFYGVDSGIVNAYVVTVAGFPATLTAGLITIFVPGTVNTGPATANIGGTGVQNIVNWFGAALTGGEINGETILLWNGTAWQLVTSATAVGNQHTAAENYAIANFGVIGPVNLVYPPGNALRYGADPTGSLDSTTTLQNGLSCMWAIYNYVDGQGLWSGGGGADPVFIIPPGKYKISNTLFVPNGVTVTGTAHPAHTINHTRIIMNSTGITPARVWGAALNIPVGAQIQATPSGSSLSYYNTAAGGVSGGSVPAWPTSGSVTDGSVTWNFIGLCTAGDNRNNAIFKFGRGPTPRTLATSPGTSSGYVNSGVTSTIQQLEFWCVAIGGTFSYPLSGTGYAYGDYPQGGALVYDIDAADSDVIDCVFQNNPASFRALSVPNTAGAAGADGYVQTGRGVGVFFDRCEFDSGSAHVYATNSYLYTRHTNCEMFGAPHEYQNCNGTVVYEGGLLFGNASIDGSTVANSFTQFSLHDVYCEPPGGVPLISLTQTGTTPHGLIDISDLTCPSASTSSCISVAMFAGGKINNNQIFNSGQNSSAGSGLSSYVAAIKAVDCTYLDIKANNIANNLAGTYNGFGILTASNLATSQFNCIDGNTVSTAYAGAPYNGQSRYINISAADVLGANYSKSVSATAQIGGSLLLTGLSADGQANTATAISANGWAITPITTSVIPLAPTAAYVSITLAAGVYAGQRLTLINQSIAANSLTMAASGTSNVADGTSCVIAGLSQKTFVWDSLTSLWYHS